MIRIPLALVLIAGLALPALAAQDAVVKDGGKVYIPGVERLEWGKNQDCTYIGALTAVAHYVGDKDVTYDFLMGVSGQAFRVQKWAKGWCPSAGDSACGFNCCEKGSLALAYDFQWLGWHAGESDAKKFEAMGKGLMESIDKGNIGITEAEDYGVAVGYQDGGKTLLCRSYNDKGDEYTAGKYPWALLMFKGKRERPDRKKLILQSLDYAIEMAGKPQYGDYLSGAKAYADWIGALVDESAFRKMNAEEFRTAAQANSYCYASLIDARASAARYLQSVKGELGSDASPHLLAAAGIYERIVEKLRPIPVVYYWEVDKKPWTSEMRHDEAVVLKSVSTMEKRAVQEIKQARAEAR